MLLTLMKKTSSGGAFAVKGTVPGLGAVINWFLFSINSTKLIIFN